ncbi:hypothetical protein KY334_00710 [Candidatus Woesearchaeota archaeon]|nr:hypothetical protein [Candidatus Woesearchaeota archaeon]
MKKSLDIQLKTLLKNSFLLTFLFLLVSCSTQLNDTISKVESIDNEYNVKLSDYSFGLQYFDKYAREVNDSQKELNQEDFDSILERLDLLKADITDEDSLKYIDLRYSLYKAEKTYLIAERKPFTNYKSVLRCSKANELVVSYSEVREAISYINESVQIYNEIDFKKKLDLPENFEDVIEASNKELLSYINEREDVITQNCNQSQTE